MVVEVSDTGTAEARSCVSVSGPVTATEPVIVVEASETGTADARSCVSVSGPLTGCVACQKVPVTGVDGIVAMETGCVACQKVPDTGTADWFDAMTTGTDDAIRAWPCEGVLVLMVESVASVAAPPGSGRLATDMATAEARSWASVSGPLAVTVQAPDCVTGIDVLVTFTSLLGPLPPPAVCTTHASVPVSQT